MNNKGISPVIATVIIVAVAIAVSIAVAFWMTGIVGLFTGFEQVQITSIYATKNTDGTYTITLTLKNTGTSSATIDNVFINSKPFDVESATVSISTEASTLDTTNGYSLSPGSTVKMWITLPSSYKSGQSVEIKVHTASGKEYPKLVVLP